MKENKSKILSAIRCVAMFICLVGIGSFMVVCNANGKSTRNVENDSISEDTIEETINVVKAPVEIVDTCGLRIYSPNYSKIDLVCGTMPSKDNQSVIMFAEAAFTGGLLEEFNHSNVAGNHVSCGEFHKGYTCKRNNGAFVYYDGTPKFLHKEYASEMRKAAERGGCGVAQEMMIHKGKDVPHTRPNSNVNEFRALCLIDGKIAIADSKGAIEFGDFIKNLHNAGATEALYLDMGGGWNYSWYRDADSTPVEIHPTPTKYATNWITFYR